MPWSHPYLKGYTAPWSPGGTAGIMPSIPRDQAVQGLVFHFRADEEAHRQFLPPLLEPDPAHPGECIWLFAHHTATPLGEDCSDWHPDRLGATESLLGVVCQYNGVAGTYYNYNFVDTDWDLAVMLYFGFPAKLARFATTPTHPEHPHLNGLHQGSRRVATVDRLGQRLVTARATLQEKIALEDSPLREILTSYGVRHVPNLDLAADGRPLAFDLVREHGYDHVFGELWRGTGELTFHEAENEELHLLSPREVLSAYHLRFTYRTKGVDVLHNYLDD